MHILALALFTGLLTDPTPIDPTALLTAFTDAITANVPVVIGVFGAVIGLVFLIVLGNFIIRRVRGSVK